VKRWRLIDALFDVAIIAVGGALGTVLAWLCAGPLLLGGPVGAALTFLLWRAFDVDRA
jgi:hypothetical protein